MTQVQIISCAFTGSDGTSLVIKYGTTVWNGATGLEVRGNGFDGTSAAADRGDLWGVSSTDDAGALRSQFSKDQYAKITVTALPGTNNGPGVIVRGSTGGNGYVLRVNFMANVMELVRFDAGTPTVLGTGPSLVGAGNTIELRGQGTSLDGLYNGVSELTVTDATYESGLVGVYSAEDAGVALGDNLLAGNMASLRHPILVPVLRDFGSARRNRERRLRQRTIAGREG